MLFNSTLTAQCVVETEFSKRTQAGVDLSLKKVEVILGGGMVLKDKTIIRPECYENYPTSQVDGHVGWTFTPGCYSVTFNEGVVVPKNAQAVILHRSSVWRMGNMLVSPWWDAGFHCENMNTTMVVNTPFFVEENARIAQITFWEMYEPAEQYHGQWNGVSSAYRKPEETKEDNL